MEILTPLFLIKEGDMKTRSSYSCIALFMILVLSGLISGIAQASSHSSSETKWKGNANVAAEIKSGNTDRTSASVGAEGTRQTIQDRYNLRVLYNYAEENDIKTTYDVYGAGKYDYFISEKLYAYISLELLKDEFKNLNLRSVIGPGVGYQVWDNDIRTLSVEAGISYFSEDRDIGDDDQWATGRLAANFGYIFRKTISFTDSIIIYPNLEDSGEYTLRNEAVLATAIGTNWSLRFSNILEQDSDPSAGVEKSDWQWLLGLQYNFEL